LLFHNRWNFVERFGGQLYVAAQQKEP